MTRVVEEVTGGAERAAICERVLRALPQWFGIEDATREYIDRASELETLVVKDDGELVVLDAVPPEGNDPHGSKWLDLLMLVLSGGRERTADEWRRLLDRAGMRIDVLDDGLIEATCL
jgi:hypothetical protein